MASKLSDEQVISLLEMLFTNMNNLDQLYYDMFINTTPMDLTLERYNEDGVKETFTLPNRAKDRQNTLQGRGTPEGAVTADIGTLYFDILTNNIYIKISDSSANGWVLLRTTSNFIAEQDFLTPYGSASHLSDISATSIQGGILEVGNGGTGNTGLTGILKGNGTNPIVSATANVDYAIPQTTIGMLGLFPCIKGNLPTGWLPADGSLVNINDYPALYKVIGDTFLYKGTEWDRTSDAEYNIAKFALPDYQNYHIRGWSGLDSQGKVTTIGQHELGGIPNATGTGIMWYTGNTATYANKVTGALYVDTSKSNDYRDVNDSCTGANSYPISLDLSRCSDVYKNDLNEVRVDSIYTLICIYAGILGEDYR
jgi:hypothetical protein